MTRLYPLELSEDDRNYLGGFDLIHTGLYSHTGHLLPELETLGIPISFDFSDDFTDTQVEQNITYADFAFFSCSHMTDEETQNYIRSNRKKRDKFWSRHVAVTDPSPMMVRSSIFKCLIPLTLWIPWGQATLI